MLFIEYLELSKKNNHLGSKIHVIPKTKRRFFYSLIINSLIWAFCFSSFRGVSGLVVTDLQQGVLL